MNYYEELGVSQEATGEEIRKAHRRLVKLMHPDAQLDHSLKGLAETQMRRLNSIVSTLLDIDQRRAYDEQLRTESAAPASDPTRPNWRGVPWWLASAIGAVVLTLLAVWLWADHLSKSFGKTNQTVYVRPVENPPVAAAEKLPLPPPMPDETLTTRVGNPPNDGASVPADPHPSTDPLDEPSSHTAVVVPPEVHTFAPPAYNPPSSSSVAKSSSSDLASFRKKEEVKTKPASVIPPVSTSHLTVAPAPAQHADPPPARVPAPVPAPATTAANQVVASDDRQKKSAGLPAPTLIAKANTKDVRNGNQVISPPAGLNASTPPRDEGGSSVAAAPLQMASVPKPEPVNVPEISRTGASMKPRDPLEGEWIYAPKEPERRKAGFYPPEFIDLKLFPGSGDVGNLHGQYSARYVITDKPISPEVSFQLASVDKDSRKFVWQGINGSHGTIAIHPVDDNTIRIEWRTTSSVRGPALTSGAATLVRRP